MLKKTKFKTPELAQKVARHLHHATVEGDCLIVIDFDYAAFNLAIALEKLIWENDCYITEPRYENKLHYRFKPEFFINEKREMFWTVCGYSRHVGERLNLPKSFISNRVRECLKAETIKLGDIPEYRQEMPTYVKIIKARKNIPLIPETVLADWFMQDSAELTKTHLIEGLKHMNCILLETSSSFHYSRNEGKLPRSA
ncbi:hypothetical protein [Microcoleus sp. B3-D7]|uniref:hypothetical protein n=1 Tax=Microcoleus sp. B3-D7 TaxID=2818659 RepID=UPI002FD34CC2